VDERMLDLRPQDWRPRPHSKDDTEGTNEAKDFELDFEVDCDIQMMCERATCSVELRRRHRSAAKVVGQLAPTGALPKAGGHVRPSRATPVTGSGATRPSASRSTCLQRCARRPERQVSDEMVGRARGEDRRSTSTRCAQEALANLCAEHQDHHEWWHHEEHEEESYVSDVDQRVFDAAEKFDQNDDTAGQQDE